MNRCGNGCRFNLKCKDVSGAPGCFPGYGNRADTDTIPGLAAVGEVWYGPGSNRNNFFVPAKITAGQSTTSFKSLLNPQQFHFKNPDAVGRDSGSGAIFTVSQLGRNEQLPFIAHSHQLQ